MAGVSRSYLSKARNGHLQEMSHENLTSLAKAVELTPQKMFGLLGIQEPTWVKALSAAAASSGGKLVKLRFPYISSVPDHLWPLLARDLFRQHNIELIPEPLSLSGFKTSMNDVVKGAADTVCGLNSEWLNDAPFAGLFHPICITHLYHGFALIGRDYSKEDRSRQKSEFLRDLESSPTLRNLFVMLAELRYNNVFGEKKRITLEPSLIAIMAGGNSLSSSIKVAQADAKTKGMLTGLALNKVKPHSGSTLTFLEPLSDVGDSRIDFVVGHALTTAKAMELESF